MSVSTVVEDHVPPEVGLRAIRGVAIVVLAAVGLVLATVVALVAPGQPIAWVAVVALVVALVLVGRSRWLATPRRLLAAWGAVPLEDVALEAAPRVRNLVDGLVVARGFPVPALHVVDVDTVNAAVVGTSPQNTSLVLTRGLVEGAGRVELEGVLAQTLGRLRSRQVELVTALAVAPRGVAMAPKYLGPRPAMWDDLAAVQVTRYPPGLASALRLARDRGVTVPGVTAAAAPCWMVDPRPEQADADALSLHDRIELLEEL